MSAESYAKVRLIFHQVCELEPAQQSIKLDEFCAGDSETRNEVERLLDALSESETLGLDLPEMFEPQSTFPQIDGYQILRVLGEGGMGTVYEAEQTSPRRRVSIKVIRFGSQRDTLLSRFRREAEVLARLKHPGIAQIYATGFCESENRSLPYIAIELIEGQSLLEHAKSEMLDKEQRLELACKLCDAIEHAHLQGVIHRDLKPSNILVDSSGQPKVLDFGIARITDSDMQVITMQTQAGQILGTAAYMSPEQASGNPDEIDARSDIYSLGVVIYELLTGRRPHQIENLPIPDAIRAVRENEPTKIGTVDTKFRGDIETILSKSLERDSARRYQSARSLGDDIRRFLRNDPIIARPPSAIYKLRKFTSRNKAVVTALAAVFVVLTLGLIGTSIAFQRESNARKATAIALTHAKGSSEFLENILLGLDANQAQGRDTELLLDMLNIAAETIDDVEYPSVRADMLSVIGRAYFAIYEYEQAADMFSRASALFDSLETDYTPSHIVSDRLLADSWRNMGRSDDAIKLLDESVERLETNDTPDLMIGTLTLLSEVRMGMGKWGDALSSVESARELSAQNLDEISPGLDMLYGMLLRRFERYDEAEESYLVALEKYQRDGDKVQVSKVYVALALVAKNTGQLQLAEQRYREAIKLRLEVDQRLNPQTAIATSNLGRLLVDMGKYEEAIPMLEQSIDMHVELYGEDYFAIAYPMASIARSKSSMGHHLEAIKLIDQALGRFIGHFGQVHPVVAATLSDKGLFLTRSSQYAQAQLCYEESLAIISELNLSPVVYETPVRERLADLFVSQDKIEDAVSCLQTAIDHLDSSEDELIRSIELRIQELRQES